MAERQDADDRRQKPDRRSGEDRRQNDGEDYDGPERRQDDRRSGPRRAAERRNLIKIGAYGLAMAAVPVLILVLLTTFQEPVRRPRGARTMDVETVEEKDPAAPMARLEEADPEPPAEPGLTGVEALRNDLLNLAPELYHSVKLESLISKDDPTAVDSTATVEAIEFNVKAQRWDTMGSGDKVQVLNNTFSFLKTRFPGLTRTVRLIFDDGRPNLDLKFE